MVSAGKCNAGIILVQSACSAIVGTCIYHNSLSHNYNNQCLPYIAALTQKRDVHGFCSSAFTVYQLQE